MSMTQAQFEKFVKELDPLARQYPQKYKLRVKLLANLGYAYIISLIILSLGLTGVLIYIAWSFPVYISSGSLNVIIFCVSLLPFAIALIIIKALKVYFPKPKGLELKRQEVPELFQFIDQLVFDLKTPKFDHILLTEDMNAGVVQLPRFLGFSENYLLLGLPLMSALSLEQFQGILAHELGHLSRNHSRLQGHVYLVRQTWYQVWKRLQEESGRGSTFLVDLFLNWYAPFLYAYSFVAARLDEYEADHCAVEMAGAKSVAEALINIEISCQYLETSFWRNVYKQACYEKLTPATVFTDLLHALAQNFSIEEKKNFLNWALDQRTTYSDTHPCLSERLVHIGYSPIRNGRLVVPDYPKVNAAQSLFNSSLESYIRHFNQKWQRQVSLHWFKLHKRYQELQDRIEYLERQLKVQPLQFHKAWELANLVREVQGDEAALSKFISILDIDSNCSEVNYIIGSILLKQEDARGVQYIETAIDQDHEKGELGCELIRTFMRRQGNSEMAEFYRERGDLYHQGQLIFQEECSRINAKSRFISHNLSRDRFDSLSRQLSQFPQIKEAYIVQTILQVFPEKPRYVLGIVRYRDMTEDNSYERDKTLLDELYSNLNFPDFLYIVLLNPVSRWNLKWVLSRVPRSKIPSC